MADEMSKKLAGPIDQVAPGLNRLADTLNAPIITSFPTDLSAFVDAINDLVLRRRVGRRAVRGHASPV